MNKRELLKSMYSHNDYPTTIYDDAGLGYIDGAYKVRVNSNKDAKARRVLLEITSRPDGMYYGNLTADGVKLVHKGDPHHSKVVDSTLTNVFLKPTYEFEMRRQVTSEELEHSDDLFSRWFGFSEGDYTSAFENNDEIVTLAKKCFKKRFKGTWELWVSNYIKNEFYKLL